MVTERLRAPWEMIHTVTRAPPWVLTATTGAKWHPSHFHLRAQANNVTSRVKVCIAAQQQSRGLNPSPPTSEALCPLSLPHCLSLAFYPEPLKQMTRVCVTT